MKLGVQVGLGTGHIVLDGVHAPPPPKGTAPNFWSISGVAKWLDGLRCHLVWRWAAAQANVLDGHPALPSKKGAQPLNFLSIVAKRLDG